MGLEIKFTYDGKKLFDQNIKEDKRIKKRYILSYTCIDVFVCCDKQISFICYIFVHVIQDAPLASSLSVRSALTLRLSLRYGLGKHLDLVITIFMFGL